MVKARSAKKGGRERPVRRDASGRVHLVLHGEGRARRVTLSAPLFTEQWQNEVTVSAANSCLQRLHESLDGPTVVALTKEAMNATSELGESFLSRAANGRVACTPGCDHCCHQSVGVTMAEALTIADHVIETRSPEELATLKQRLASARERTRGLSADERYSPNHPCPFLESSRCTIYEVRPLSCRGMNSLDAQACASILRDPDAHARFLATGEGAPAFLEPIRAFHAVSAGLQLSLSELFGLDMLPLDLTAAIDALLENDAAIALRWLRGESPLAEARGGDSTGSARGGEMSGRVPTRR